MNRPASAPAGFAFGKPPRHKPEASGVRSAVSEFEIRPAAAADHDAIWRIFQGVVAPGDTYAFPPDIDREQGLGAWFAPGIETFVALDANEVVGTYTLKANQAGPGDHVANCAYMVDPEARGRGVGRAMAEHSFVAARSRGFRAMQYNFVVSTNNAAVRLWQELGFAIVGTLPGAFRHPRHGYVDSFVMHRWL